ncbi:MAG: hypothetical protein HN909_03540 [Phycisphaerales bacterium]|jgi:hypothetical protein|nr:hypothetical protein [Phycisphaerales bacterium]MBT7170825.1 hypothetical protein [Phycisphaerales bacterium]
MARYSCTCGYNEPVNDDLLGRYAKCPDCGKTNLIRAVIPREKVDLAPQNDHPPRQRQFTPMQDDAPWIDAPLGMRGFFNLTVGTMMMNAFVLLLIVKELTESLFGINQVAQVGDVSHAADAALMGVSELILFAGVVVCLVSLRRLSGVLRLSSWQGACSLVRGVLLGMVALAGVYCVVWGVAQWISSGANSTPEEISFLRRGLKLAGLLTSLGLAVLWFWYWFSLLEMVRRLAEELCSERLVPLVAKTRKQWRIAFWTFWILLISAGLEFRAVVGHGPFPLMTLLVLWVFLLALIVLIVRLPWVLKSACTELDAYHQGR